MFKQLLDTDFFQQVSDEAQQKIIKKDRGCYKSVFDETRKVIANDSLVILSDVATILNNKNTEMEDEIVLYTTHPRRTATKIANDIHEKYGKFVQMRAIIPNKEYSIMYNMRGLIKLYSIEKYKNIPILFNAVKINSLYYFPPEIELMDIYHKLYLPNYYDDWGKLLEQEKLLYKTFTVKGGVDKCVSCKGNRKIDINNLKLLILNFLNNENYVLVGKWAHNIIKKEKDIASDENVQIISENNINHDYQNIMSFLSSYTNYGIYFKKKKIYIPKDSRIYKYTFYIKYPTFISASKNSRGIDKPFLDIYNCGEYELIPFITKKYDDNSLRVGNLFVQLRFLLIDLWIYRLLNHLKIIDDKIFAEKKIYICSSIKMAKKYMPESFKDKFMGINYDEKIEQKISLSESQTKKSSYYPELSMKKEKKYKAIATSS
jgi:hypothetical protein